MGGRLLDVHAGHSCDWRRSERGGFDDSTVAGTRARLRVLRPRVVKASDKREGKVHAISARQRASQ